MRVDGPLPLPESTQTTGVTRSGSTGQSSSTVSVNSGPDQAQLSVDGQTIQALQASLAQLPEVRQEQVEALRQAVGSGNYQVSDQQLGDAVGSELLGAQLQLS